MKKDYIDIYDSNGKKEKMEVVMVFQLNQLNNHYNYIIYKTLDNKHYYLAKYKGKNHTKLDTFLSEEELKLAQKVLEGAVKNI